MQKKIINADLDSVRTIPKAGRKSKIITALSWGDEVNVINTAANYFDIIFDYYQDQLMEATKLSKRQDRLKKMQN
ncbi:MAG: hypothetical protein ACR2LL_07730, partial [Nitrosopumilus sp.]|uniref:hypothetical protein n=1 Tax=Nitrosopumilus sp. TaxID=2024843 RepID=UPI00292E0AF7|nr:hypothetical protein [Nitrosopumilus sp.]